MPSDQEPQSPRPSTDRYRVQLPVVRPIPARALVAGVTATVALLCVLGFAMEYGRKELVPAYMAPVGGEVRLLAPVAGTVELLAAVGQPIEKASVIAHIRADRQGALGGVEKVQLTQTDARIASLQAELRVLEADGASRQAVLRQQLTQMGTSRSRAQAEQVAREDVARLAHEDLSRQRLLVEQGFLSKSNLTQFELRASTATAEAATAARQVADSSAQESNVRAELAASATRTEVNLGEKRREIAALTGSSAELAALAETDVRAPTAGSMTALAVNTGDSVIAGQLIAKLALSTQTYEAVLQLPETVAGRVRPGMKVYIRLAAFPFETYGQVEVDIVSVEKSPLLPDETSANRTLRVPTVKAVAVIKNIPPRVDLHTGMSGTAAIEVERRKVLAWMLWPLLKHFLG